MFKKYSSIENAYRKKFIEKIRMNYPRAKFIVQEKVHGSNFQIGYDGNEFSFGKRTAKLKDDETFFDWQDVVKKQKLREKTEALYGYLLGLGYLQKDLIIYGELAGPGIQKGVFYSTEKFFYAFDILLDGKLISPIDSNNFFQIFNIFHAVTLHEGTLDSCLEFENDYNSKIPKQLGEPNEKIPKENITEGNVIKPVEPLFIGNERVILKNKNEKWSEKANKSKRNKVKKDVTLNDEEQKMFETLMSYCTENRLRNVLSKFGKVGDKDFGKLMGMMNQDVQNEFLKDEEIDKIDLPNTVRKKASKEVASFIRKHFLNIIDGEF